MTQTLAANTEQGGEHSIGSKLPKWLWRCVYVRQTQLWVKAWVTAFPAQASLQERAEHGAALPGLKTQRGTTQKWCCLTNLQDPGAGGKAGSRSSFPEADEGEHPQVLWMCWSSSHHTHGMLGRDTCLVTILLQSSPDGQVSRCFLAVSDSTRPKFL